MVRKGSPVRVRKRALPEPPLGGFCKFEASSEPPVVVGLGSCAVIARIWTAWAEASGSVPGGASEPDLLLGRHTRRLLQLGDDMGIGREALVGLCLSFAAISTIECRPS
jgi:hypothetical protein